MKENQINFRKGYKGNLILLITCEYNDTALIQVPETHMYNNIVHQYDYEYILSILYYKLTTPNIKDNEFLVS